MKRLAVILTVAILVFCGCSNSSSDENTIPSTISVTLEGGTQTETTMQTETTAQTQETEPSMVSKEYEINNITFQLPDVWILDSDTTSDMMVFNSGENSVTIIRSETIPDIMKVDVGDNSITSKEDVAEYYGIDSEDSGYVITGTQWEEINGVEYCDFWFNRDGKLRSGEPDDRIGRCVVIPINETEAVFSVIMLCDKDTYYLDHIDVILSSLNLDALK